MTFLKALASCASAFLVIVVSASAAEQPLIGGENDGRVRVLDPDLRIVPGTPALPAATDATVLSPDGRRLASWAFSLTRLTIRSSRTFRPIATRPIERGTDVFWPARDHLVTVAYVPGDGYVKRPNVIRSFDLQHGTARTVRLRGLPLATQRVGRVIRLLTVGGPDFCCPTGPFVVTDIGAGGVVERRWRVPLPDGFNAHTGMRLSGTLLLATKNRRQALIRIHSGKTKRLELPNGFYSWVGQRFIANGRHVARIDRRAMSVTGTVDTGIDDTATPFGDGFIMGFGRARYDGDLRRVAENPTPALTEGFGPVGANGRLYDLLTDCEGRADAGTAIADATTGAAIATRPGRWKFGVLGSGYLKSTAAEEICD